MCFCPEGLVLSKIFAHITLKSDSSEQKNISKLSQLKRKLKQFKISHTFINSFKFIHCFHHEQPPSLLILLSFFDQNHTVMAVYPELAKIRATTVKFGGGGEVYILILLWFNDNKGLLQYFWILIFCWTNAFQWFLDDDNPTIDADMAPKHIFAGVWWCCIILMFSRGNFNSSWSSVLSNFAGDDCPENPKKPKISKGFFQEIAQLNLLQVGFPSQTHVCPW